MSEEQKTNDKMTTEQFKEAFKQMIQDPEMKNDFRTLVRMLIQEEVEQVMKQTGLLRY